MSFQKGHKINVGRKMPEHVRKKISDTETGKNVSSITCEKIRKALTGKKLSDATKDKLRKKAIGRRWRMSKTGRLNIRKAKIGCKLSESHKASIGKASRLNWEKKEYREKTLKKIIKGLCKRPTSFEKIIADVIKKYNLPYKYVGDGAFLIGYKNPDFIDINGKKVCIEVYNNYHHPENYEEIRSKCFSKYGWKTIFINEQEIQDENIILNKLT